MRDEQLKLYPEIGLLHGTLNLADRLYNGNKTTWYGRAGGGYSGIL
ncbi:MAG: hypothetical protein U0V49_00520 [Saprospiraceae bacterium]